MVFPPGSVPPPPEEPQRPPESNPPSVPAPVVVVNADDGPAIDAWPAEPPPQSPAWRRVRRLGWELAQTLVLAVLIFLAVRAMAQNFRVEGSSMEPGLHHGQYLLVNKAIYFKINLERLSKYVPFVEPGDNPQHFLFRGPKRGDVVVFRYPADPSRDFIKRVVGLPGDNVDIQDSILTVNGVRLEETYISGKTNCSSNCHLVVPAKSYFVLGDNRGNSSDSRAWGFVPEENIIGQALLSYWPLDDLGGVGNHSIHVGFVDIPLP